MANPFDQFDSGNAFDRFDEKQPTKEMTAGDVASQAVQNLPGSFANLVGDLAHAVTHPVQTAMSVLDLGAGLLQSVLPEKLVQAIGEDERSRNVARQVGQFYVDRYGSVEGAKKAIAQDPAGVMADVASILYGGGAALKAGGLATKVATKGAIPAESLTRAGQAISTAGQYVDPLQLGLKAAGKAKDIGTAVIGQQTGAGQTAIKQAFRAGQEGGDVARSFVENMRGDVPAENVLIAARQNLEEMSRLKQAEYRSGMVNIKSDKSVLSFKEIENAVNQAKSGVKFKNVVTKAKASEKLADAEALVDQWKKLDPKEYHTPEGFDALKQAVGDVLEQIPFEQKSARSAVGGIYNSIKDSIQKQAPTYADVMKKYASASESINEIQKTLSLNKKASVDTALRKLQSIIRDNVNTNYGQRRQLADQLVQAGGKELLPALSGQALQSFVPRGLQSAAAVPTGLLSYSVAGLPGAALSALTSSPRLMGEAAYKAGQVARGIDVVGQRAPFILTPELYNLLAQSGETEKRISMETGPGARR